MRARDWACPGLALTIRSRRHGHARGMAAAGVLAKALYSRFRCTTKRVTHETMAIALVPASFFILALEDEDELEEIMPR